MQNATKVATVSKDSIGLRQLSGSLYGLHALSTINDIQQQLRFTAPRTARKLCSYVQFLFACLSVCPLHWCTVRNGYDWFEGKNRRC